MHKRYIAIIGATASGKSALALDLAESLDGELISCDSVQIYRGFNLGAAKPTEEELVRVPHHLINIREGHEAYDARNFAADAEQTIEAIRARGRVPIVVGGTGLYLKALWQDGFHDLPKSLELRKQLKDLSPEELRSDLERVDPARAAEIHDNDRFRLQRALEIALLLGHSVKDLAPPLSRRPDAFVIGMSCERKLLQERIALRSRLMLEEGLIEEVKGLLASGLDPEIKPMQSIGYLEVRQFLSGQTSRAALEERIVIATRQYAKRQETLFRKIEKDFVWTADSQMDELLHLSLRALGRLPDKDR